MAEAIKGKKRDLKCSQGTVSETKRKKAVDRPGAWKRIKPGKKADRRRHSGKGGGGRLKSRSRTASKETGLVSDGKGEARVFQPTEALVRLSVTDLNLSGQGVARHEGMVYFVNGLLPGEEGLCRVIDRRKNYKVAEPVMNPMVDGASGVVADSLVSWDGKAADFSLSSERVSPVCSLFPTCGGCDLQHLAYPAELVWKEKQVRDALSRIAGLPEAEVKALVQPVIGMDRPMAYRNKMQFPVTEEGIGFYQSRSRQVIDGDTCPAGLPAADLIRASFRHYMAAQGLTPYSTETGRGLVRHLLIREGERTGECLVCPVVTRPDLPGFSDWLETLSAELEPAGLRLASAFININEDKGNRILGKDFRHCYGAEVIYEEVGGIRYRISPASFFQVNTRQAEVLFKTTVAFADVQPTDTVFDLYGGTGSIALQLAGSCHQVIGNEIVEDAVADAVRNAQNNGIKNVRFIAGKAETVVPRLYEEGVRANVVVVDPPRKGCDRALLDTVIRMQPRRLVYVSCNPATLARDLKILLTEGNFQLEQVQPVDMFPRTTHVEALTLLVRSFIE